MDKIINKSLLKNIHKNKINGDFDIFTLNQFIKRFYGLLLNQIDNEIFDLMEIFENYQCNNKNTLCLIDKSGDCTYYFLNFQNNTLLCFDCDMNLTQMNDKKNILWVIMSGIFIIDKSKYNYLKNNMGYFYENK